MDGIIADFVTSACKLHKLDNPYLKPEYQGVYGIETIFGMTPAQFWEPIDYKFWRNLGKMPDADCIVQVAIDRFGKKNVCILSSPCRTRRGECIDGKSDWIDEYYPELRSNILFGSAKRFCASKDAFLIDDLDYNVETFVENGGNAWLYPRPWNSDYKHQITYVSQNDAVYEINYRLDDLMYIVK